MVYSVEGPCPPSPQGCSQSVFFISSCSSPPPTVQKREIEGKTSLDWEYSLIESNFFQARKVPVYAVQGNTLHRNYYKSAGVPPEYSVNICVC